MMTARAKRVLSASEEVQKANSAFVTESSDAFFDMIDGIYERQNERNSEVVKLITGIVEVNLKFASDVYEILTGTHD